jgi:hypothetical protein
VVDPAGRTVEAEHGGDAVESFGGLERDVALPSDLLALREPDEAPRAQQRREGDRSERGRDRGGGIGARPRPAAQALPLLVAARGGAGHRRLTSVDVHQNWK